MSASVVRTSDAIEAEFSSALSVTGAGSTTPAASRSSYLGRDGASSHQDLVSQADKNVELLIRAALGKHFPDDSIIGEEHAPVEGSSGYTWVIDPIDGTANFVTGIPSWCVVIA